jgi:hypothetical protein
MGAFVDLVDQRIRIYVEDDVLDAVQESAAEDWLAGKVIDATQPLAPASVHLGRVAYLRVLPDDTAIEGEYLEDGDWTFIKVRHWADAIRR